MREPAFSYDWEVLQMDGKWDADPAAGFACRLGKSAHELGTTAGEASCPEMWELDNGDIAIIGTELTSAYRDRLPPGVSIDAGEGLVVIPRSTLVSAREAIPDASPLGDGGGEGA